jgi:hypothetical protein
MTETELRAVVPEETSLGFGILVIVICLVFVIWDLVLSVIGPCDYGTYISYSWDATLAISFLNKSQTC